ncbi:fimbrial-like protein [Enterobacter pseudoroggenkampii]|uniref:fimbrial-like protein n=1 Tax=Enterobacter pseudoroggenkampii TaxID=2996112 RepID=UPI0038B3D13B
MQQLPHFLRQPGLLLLIGLAVAHLPGIARADSGMDINLTANIVNSTCKLTVEDGGEIFLPVVMQSWFYNSDSSDRFLPTDYAEGTPFTIHVDDCHQSGGGTEIRQLQFSFSPQSGFGGNQKQVFKNDDTSADAAKNVGIVVFSSVWKTNVLNSDGSSKVIYNVSSQNSADYLTDYQFSARYQNTGAVTGGYVTSNVLVDVSYE